jgi:hypothetical protein
MVKAGEEQQNKEAVVDRFPSKGAELGRLLLDEMKVRKEKVPPEIEKVFAKLVAGK